MWIWLTHYKSFCLLLHVDDWHTMDLFVNYCMWICLSHHGSLCLSSVEEMSSWVISCITEISLFSLVVSLTWSLCPKVCHLPIPSDIIISNSDKTFSCVDMFVFIFYFKLSQIFGIHSYSIHWFLWLLRQQWFKTIWGIFWGDGWIQQFL
jgi:hypothetical protein